MDGGQPTQAYPPETFADNRSGIIIGIVVICWVLASTVVTLRVYTRKVLLNQIGTDDYFAVASLVSLLLSPQWNWGHCLLLNSYRLCCIYWAPEIY